MSAPGNVRRGTPAQVAWWASPAFKALGKRMARQNLAAFRDGPKCAAARKRDGEPCCRPALKGSKRCRLHGAASPKGAGWLRPVWPDKNDPRAELKLSRKLAQLAREQRKRERRIARMTPTELQAYRDWQRAHQPGPPGLRARLRAERRSDPQMAAIVAAALAPRSAPGISPELQKIEAEIARLRTETAALKAEALDFENDQREEKS